MSRLTKKAIYQEKINRKFQFWQHEPHKLHKLIIQLWWPKGIPVNGEVFSEVNLVYFVQVYQLRNESFQNLKEEKKIKKLFLLFSWKKTKKGKVTCLSLKKKKKKKVSSRMLKYFLPYAIKTEKKKEHFLSKRPQKESYLHCVLKKKHFFCDKKRWSFRYHLQRYWSMVYIFFRTGLHYWYLHWKHGERCTHYSYD